jgi:sugar O-acyltransferase (sialic acid O-acetyltransferase NeuD family)
VSSPIAVYGSGGSGREVAWLAEQCGREVVGFVDDDPSKIGRIVNDLPVLSIASAKEKFPDLEVALGIGNSAARGRAVTEVIRHGLPFAALVHPGVVKSRWVTIGTGSIICAGSVVTTNVAIGDYVQINIACTISHDVELGDLVTLAPGVHVSGAVKIGTRAFLGTGANVINGTPGSPLTIGSDAVIGAGACVIGSVDAGVTVVGVPARPIPVLVSAARK